MPATLNLTPKKQLIFDQNKQAIAKSGIFFKEKAGKLLLRESGKPRIDFFPSTGRWRVIDHNQTLKGGVEAFLQWYNEQKDASDIPLR